MQSLIQIIFGYTNFEPHSVHFISKSGTSYAMWLIVFGNGLAFLAYLLIPIVIIYVIRNRKDLVYNWMVLLFGVFILLCGITHLMHVIIFWYPVYYLDAIIRVTTFIISIATGIMFFYIMPKIVQLVSPKQIQDANTKLSSQIEFGKENIKSLTQKSEELKGATEDLSLKNQEFEKMNSLMAGRDLKIKELKLKVQELKQKNV